MSSLADSLNFVLVRPSHPGNIGAAARALKVMDQRNLALVSPDSFPSPVASARASGANDLLESARVVETLPEAIGEATLVFGTTVRERAAEWPIVTPREAGAYWALEEIGSGGKVAVVFGREAGGLLNDELACCHQLIRIPVSADYGTLNLAAAVQVIAYEFNLLDESAMPDLPAPAERAEMADIEALLQRLDRTMLDSGFLEGEKDGLARQHLRRFFLRAEPTLTEIKLFHGILKAMGRR